MSSPGSEAPNFFRTWSIGVFVGPSPLALKSPPRCVNPVISARDVSDVRAEFVADPFLIRADSAWHMFFEVVNRSTRRGVVGLAQSIDGLEWTYRQVVLDEAFHLSYPCVFQWDGEIYMLPETLAPNAVRLYRAVDFPTRWAPAREIINGQFADPTIFHYQGYWWLFVCPHASTNAGLELYLAEHLYGPWRAHPCNPLVLSDPRRARPAGRVAEWNGKLIRYAQTCWPVYGSCVRAFEIVRLNPNEYHEVELDVSPILDGSGSGWNASGMHHVDPQPLADGSWLASVDGCFSEKTA